MERLSTSHWFCLGSLWGRQNVDSWGSRHRLRLFNMELFHHTVTAAPFGGSVTLVGVSLDNPYANFPGGTPFPYLSTPGHGVFPAGGQYLPMPANLQPPEVQQWN